MCSTTQTKFPEKIRKLFQKENCILQEDVLDAIEANEISSYADKNFIDRSERKIDTIYCLLAIYDELQRENPDENDIKQTTELLKGYLFPYELSPDFNTDNEEEMNQFMAEMEIYETISNQFDQEI